MPHSMTGLLHLCFVTLSLFVLIGSSSTEAKECIVRIETEIWVHDNSDITMHETIELEVTGSFYKHGFRYYIPISDTATPIRPLESNLTAMSITRNGVPEPYAKMPSTYGVLLFVGDPSKPLPHGRQTYKFKYRASGLLRPWGKKLDYFMWDGQRVKGYNIDKLKVRVHLPDGADPKSVKAAGEDFSQGSHSERDLWFESNSPVNWIMGFVVEVLLKKGVVPRRSDEKNQP